jgi:methanogenic corrinoid protein MtbC1
MSPAGEAGKGEVEYAAYLAALLAGDRWACHQTFVAWLERGVELRVIYEDLIQRSLYDVGLGWERGEVSVATEHLATAITESLLNIVYPRLFQGPRNGRSAVVTCLANEYHQMGGRLVADVFELHGWRSYFLGANTPLRDVIDLTGDKRPAVVALSLTVPVGLGVLCEATAALRAAFPRLPILVGGQAFRWGGRERAEALEDVRYLGTLGELEAWMQSFPGHAR